MQNRELAKTKFCGHTHEFYKSKVYQKQNHLIETALQTIFQYQNDQIIKTNKKNISK